jgi:uncharacterized protein (TIGR02058 family)
MAKRIILEMGSGNDLHGGDYTKAAIRAVQDALHHSSLAFLRTLGLDSKQMQVEVTIGAQRPERVDAASVKATLPHGEVTVRVVKGGLDIPSDDGHDTAIVASAAVAVRMELPQRGSALPAANPRR